MLRSFTIKNFRCFKDLTIEPLERVNLIAGKNNVGKTAALEAIFLHLGANKPELPLQVNLVRGIQLLSLSAVDVWGWMFFNKEISQTIELTSLHRDDVSASVKARLVEPGKSRLDISANAEPPKLVGPLTTMTGPSELVLEYQDTTGQKGIMRGFIASDGKIEYEHAPLGPFPLCVFLGTWPHGLMDNAGQFSKLEEVGRQDEVLKELKHLEQRLSRLAVGVTGSTSMIRGDIGIGRLLPLPLMGEGIVRLLSILLAIASVPGGVVLIDEVENGLHHSVMVNVWKAIAEAARRSDVQIFATTHSEECILAAHAAFQEAPDYDLAFHRLQRVEGEIQAVTHNQRMIDVALKTDLEIR
jgi:hypothetical protein